jgi:hypothetical protein
MNAKNGFPVFSTHIEANYVSKSTDAWNVYKLTDEDRQKITALAADPRIGERHRMFTEIRFQQSHARTAGQFGLWIWPCTLTTVPEILLWASDAAEPNF